MAFKEIIQDGGLAKSGNIGSAVKGAADIATVIAGGALMSGGAAAASASNAAAAMGLPASHSVLGMSGTTAFNVGRSIVAGKLGGLGAVLVAQGLQNSSNIQRQTAALQETQKLSSADLASIIGKNNEKDYASTHAAMAEFGEGSAAELNDAMAYDSGMKAGQAAEQVDSVERHYARMAELKALDAAKYWDNESGQFVGSMTPAQMMDFVNRHAGPAVKAHMKKEKQ